MTTPTTPDFTFRTLVRNRIQELKALNGLPPEERARRLVNRLWLLDPSWEPSAEVVEARPITPEGSLGATALLLGGDLTVIDLRSTLQEPTASQLQRDGFRYVAASECSRVLFVVQEGLREDPDRVHPMMESIGPGSAILRYDTCLHSAYNLYTSYLERNARPGRFIDQMQLLARKYSEAPPLGAAARSPDTVQADMALRNACLKAQILRARVGFDPTPANEAEYEQARDQVVEAALKWHQNQ